MNNLRRTRHRISVFFSVYRSLVSVLPARADFTHRGSGHPRSTRPRRVSRFASGIVLSPHNVRDRYLAGYRQCIAFHGCTSPFSFFFYALSTSSASTCLEKRVHTYGTREVRWFFDLGYMLFRRICVCVNVGSLNSRCHYWSVLKFI